MDSQRGMALALLNHSDHAPGDLPHFSSIFNSIQFIKLSEFKWIHFQLIPSRSQSTPSVYPLCITTNTTTKTY